MTPSAIVFDLDDTLYLEREYVRSGFCAVGEWFRGEFGFPDFSQRACALFMAGKRGDIFNSVVASYGIEPDTRLITHLVTIYRGHRPAITLLPDAGNCLNALYGNYPLALITDGPAISQWNKIRALGIESLFEAIVVTSESGEEYAKPHPLAFCLVEQRLGLRGSQLVYVGDNPRKDFQAPRQLGWHSVRVEREEGIYSAVPTSEQAEFRIPDLGELLALLPTRLKVNSGVAMLQTAR
jgi:putative hydrolase of the HAD superfamily